ncbi:ABC transporter substrate-binding protein [Erysipelothrix urinaevulpis]|uniref:ABC transporter substrate-binding protein n=1 Tax=Erysipelothrix urinaevulpis TaxID=2683717 RepID=UPI0013593A1E|nr:ABC transporter substrate-binding protein [Erysipelothrix urinaevulpis]
MKKLFTILIASLLVLTACSSKPKAGGTLTVAAPSNFNGDFIAGFSSNAYDRWVQELLNYDYGVFYSDRETSDLLDNPTVVEKVDVADKGGDKEYTFTLKAGNKFSDGTEITAKDYVFTVLMRANPKWKATAKMDNTGDKLVGYADYSAGKSATFDGVKYIDDKTFSLTISKDELPYYFERASVAVSPTPMAAWFKDAKFNADGNGFDNTDEEITAAVKEISEKERFAPTVTAGPYKFESNENNTATVVVNEHYAGNFEGKTPSIEKVVVRQVESSLSIQALENNEVDFVPGVIEGKLINQAKEKELQTHSYPRNGFGNIVLKANKGPTQIKEVRQALGFLLNRQEFVSKIVGGYGSVVNAPYGLSQWFYKENKDRIESELIEYTYNLTKANELLDQTDYKFEKDGSTPFDVEKASEDYRRHNSKGEKLLIKHFGSEKNDVTDLIISQLVPAATEAGVEYAVDQGDFATLGAYMQGTQDNDYNAFNLATSFTSMYDPWQNESQYVNTGLNWSDIEDDKLDATIKAVQTTKPGDKDAFADNIMEYFKVWNDLLFQIPLYSNEYFDITTTRVKGVDVITPEMDWAKSIVYLSVE